MSKYPLVLEMRERNNYYKLKLKVFVWFYREKERKKYKSIVMWHLFLLQIYNKYHILLLYSL